MKPFLLLISSLMIISFQAVVYGQSPGDTVVVQSLVYNSNTRDTMVTFPQFNSNDIERVWMRYSMRCENGLAGGCAAWDYSCNTYVTDSSRIDSIAASVNSYVVYPFDAPNNSYSTSITNSIYQRNHQQTAINSTSNLSSYTIGTGAQTSGSFMSATALGGKYYFLIPVASLTNAGLTAGTLNGMSLFNSGSGSQLKDFRIAIKEVSYSNLSATIAADFTDFTEVYYDNLFFGNGEQNMVFYQAFNWSGTGALLIELSAKGIATNPGIQLAMDATTGVQGLSSHDNKYGRFITNSYVQVPGYLGVGGAAPRTIEFWMKTAVLNKAIVSWGADIQGEKLIIRLNSNGAIRAEINGGNVVGTMPLNDDKWHHVAIVFNGANLSNVSFYVDGNVDAVGSITNLAINTAASAEVQISKSFSNAYWNGGLDDIRIWSAALSQTTIKANLFKQVNAQHPNYAALELNYLFDDGSATQVTDNSPHSRNGVFYYNEAFGSQYGLYHDRQFLPYLSCPKVKFNRATYNLTNTPVTYLDTVPRESYIIEENQFTPNPGTLISDITTQYYELWPDSNRVYNPAGTIAQQIYTTNPQVLTNATISYWNRMPSKIELLSFVTPYGNGLNFGVNGKSWYFDVTDYLPILRGNKRLTMERGGQWQEEFDIQFLYVLGTPVRPVLDMRQIWKVDSKAYTAIMNDTEFAQRTIKLVNGNVYTKVRSAITGHGQEGEFIPRNHFINVNNGQQIYNWQVWKVCGENPVYPQGGTWIYDRAGWCPGMATDVKEYDITSYVQNGQVAIDYGVTTATGTSNYIVNNQIVSYGAISFTTDARLVTVKEPSNRIEYGRSNPVCSNPVVQVENTGSSPITSLLIQYQVNNGTVQSYTWTGTLNFGSVIDISLPSPAALWSTVQAGTNNTFTATIAQVNGAADQYALNNVVRSLFNSTDILPSSFIFRFKSNNAPAETQYNITDANGTIIKQRTSMTASTVYDDTLNLVPGCYSINIIDNGGDGISFWANSDGAGYAQTRTLANALIKTFQPDFGNSLRYEFSIPDPLGLEELESNASVSLAPNPSSTEIVVSTTGMANANWQIVDLMGKVIATGITSGEYNSSQTIDIRDYKPGFYLLQINGTRSSKSVTFIKM